MNSHIIYAISWLIVGIITFRDWKRYRYKDILWFLRFSIIGFCAELIYYFLIISGVPQNSLSVAEFFFRIFDPIVMVAVVWIVARRIMQK